MKNSQLSEILRALSKTEFREFGKFVRSPFFNNRSEVIRFYDSLKKFYPHFSSNKFTVENFFPGIYPGKKFSVVLMRKLISLMLNLLLSYLAELKFKSNELEYSLELICALKERKLFRMHEKKMLLFNKHLDSLKHTMETYEYKYKAENELRQIDEPSGEKARIAKLESPLDKIYAYFFSVILNEHLYLFSLADGINKEVALKMFNEIMSYTEKAGYKRYPLIRLYYLMLMLRNTRDEKYFYELFNFRKEEAQKFIPVHNSNALIIMIGYCEEKYLTGLIEYRKILFSLSQTLINEDLIDPKFTEPMIFTNIIRNSSFLRETEWSIMFINKCKRGLNPAIRDSIINYVMGMVEFSRHNFGKSLQYLALANVKWRYMNYDIKKIILKVYFELGYNEELNLQIDAFKHYMKNDKETPAKSLNRHALFIKFMAELNNLRIKENYKPAQLLKKKIEKSAYFPNKEWLMEKSGELIKKAI